jgi:hypothetical protein
MSFYLMRLYYMQYSIMESKLGCWNYVIVKISLSRRISESSEKPPLALLIRDFWTFSEIS